MRIWNNFSFLSVQSIKSPHNSSINIFLLRFKSNMKFSIFVFVIALIYMPKLAISFRNNIPIDDFLNGDLELFPNATINLLHISLEDELLEWFKGLLDDDEILNEAYDSFKRAFLVKGSERSSHYNGFQRKFLFKENLIYIFHHNLLARYQSSSTFEMGVNKFADMHEEEFKSERLGLIIPDDNHHDIENHPLLHHPNPNDNDFMSEARHKNLPSSFDWRDHNVISPVKDQEKCGACVMFSLTAALEAHHAICKNKQIIDLSEQFIIDCAVRENGYRKNKGCDGNTYPDSLKFVVDHGITSEHLYPYEGKQGKCSFDGMRPAVQLKGFKKLKDNVDHVKYAVANDGPVAIGIYVHRPFLFYKSGIYDHCGSSGQSVGGHAMIITGFKDESSNVKYYNIKNQWGEQWGENGYIRYTSTDPRCGLEKLAYSLQLEGC